MWIFPTLPMGPQQMMGTMNVDHLLMEILLTTVILMKKPLQCRKYDQVSQGRGCISFVVCYIHVLISCTYYKYLFCCLCLFSIYILLDFM